MLKSDLNVVAAGANTEAETAAWIGQRIAPS